MRLMCKRGIKNICCLEGPEMSMDSPMLGSVYSVLPLVFVWLVGRYVPCCQCPAFPMCQAAEPLSYRVAELLSHRVFGSSSVA
jgi:hypothetical protein